MKNKLKKVISLVSFLFIINVQAETTVFIEDLHFERNQKEKLVSINMTNDTEFTAFQMDVYLPSGLEFKSNNNGYFIENDRIENSKHNLMCAKQDEGFYRILCYSKSNTNIKGNIGVLFYVTIVANNTFEGKGELIIKDIVLTKDDGTEYNPKQTTAIVHDYMTSVDVTLADVDTNAEYYNLQGVKVAKVNLTQGIYIKKKGGKAVKVMLK